MAVSTITLDRSTFPVVFFDADDTLWMTEPLYDQARQNAADIVAAAGLDPDRWSEHEMRLDVQNFKIFGLSSNRFPTSCRQSYEWLAQDSGVPVVDGSPKTDPRRMRDLVRHKGSSNEEEAPHARADRQAA